jgi:phage replication O-like protein O
MEPNNKDTKYNKNKDEITNECNKSGYTRIPHKMMLALLTSNLSASEIKIVLYLMMATIGHNTFYANFTFDDIIKNTKVSAYRIYNYMNTLEDKKIIKRYSTKRGHNQSNGIIQFDFMNYAEWDIDYDTSIFDEPNQDQVDNDVNTEAVIDTEDDKQMSEEEMNILLDGL